MLQDPGFFEMVEYFFHKATILAEDNLIDEEMRTMRATREEKVKKAHGKIKYLDYYKPFHPGNRDLGFLWPSATICPTPVPDSLPGIVPV